MIAQFDLSVLAFAAFYHTFVGFFWTLGMVNALYLLRKPLRKVISYVRS